MQGDIDSKRLINGFINAHVGRRKLGQRTEKAYRLDLEHFYTWTEQKQTENSISKETGAFGTDIDNWEDWMEAYLDYLKKEKKLSFSTIYRKNKVFGYYLSYLTEQGVISGYRSLKLVKEIDDKKTEHSSNLLSRKEADAFFRAMKREYKRLDNEFRKRICLRDMVMMELLFYHKIEISELLRLEVQDYDQKTGILVIKRKRRGNYQIQIFSQELKVKIGLWLEVRKVFRKEGEYYNCLILSKLGKPLSMEMFIRIFDKYRKMAGIRKKLTPKDLKENCMKQYAKELAIEKWRGNLEQSVFDGTE